MHFVLFMKKSCIHSHRGVLTLTGDNLKVFYGQFFNFKLDHFVVVYILHVLTRTPTSRVEKLTKAIFESLNLSIRPPRKSPWRGRLNTVDLLVPTSLNQLRLMMQTVFIMYQTSYINEEVSCIGPSSPSIRHPCIHPYTPQMQPVWSYQIKCQADHFKWDCIFSKIQFCL
jgi:hypothetical protein